ncbi:heparinase II/III family protein [Aquirufa rosea]|uniref:Alginate lyase family protein n=1 Tax=Aquirufa rosea TaxID=2509241 RepID=A0A4Q1BYS2_9BACT|nr:heparinase II/III family protein [Aquirufa rosea]RXK48264.1 alginate lyase family protein [Aquirufa rosea]
MLNKLLRLYNTIKFLKFKQIYWRIVYLFPRAITQQKKCPSSQICKQKVFFIPRNGITVDYQSFIFLSELYNLVEIGWDNPSISKLWKYNLHYFEYLLQDNSEESHLVLQFKIIENWIASNHFGIGTGWEPYPTSIRIINWIKWHWKTNLLSECAKISLWNQIIYLESRPEYHLLGNHLFINAKALLYACAFFKLDNETSIYKTAIRIINEQIDEQFLEDGGHFELSPMYHSLAMEDLLDLISISDLLPFNFPKEVIIEKFEKGMRWLQTMIYNNEELAHFNDCANGIAPQFSKLVKYSFDLGILIPKLDLPKFIYHKSSGFVVYKDNDFHLIADIGNIGPDYLPGHAHADTLSFELSIKGHRVIVNSGTSIYGTSKERLRQRGTSAHSTVQIDNQDSSEVWSGFRVANRATPFDININYPKDGLMSFSASHDGYKRILASPIHKREFKYSNKLLEISDHISGIGNQIVSRFFIHPDIEISKIEQGFLLSKNGEIIVKLSFESTHDAVIYKSTYHDKFGLSIKNKCIQIPGKSPLIIKAKFQIIL